MKLVESTIINYRSIKHQVVTFDPSCRVLVGINESGKSNVLNALATLSPEYAPHKSDERQPLGDEAQVDESCIKFKFKLEKKDHEAVRDILNAQILAGPRAKIASIGDEALTVYGFIRTFEHLQYKVNVPKESKSGQYFTYDEKYDITDGWYKITSKCPEDFEYTDEEGLKTTLGALKLAKLSEEEHQKIPEGYLAVATFDNFSDLVHGSLIQYMKDNLPEVIFWEFEEQDFLPSHVNLAKFMEDPKKFLSLKNMFNLAGIEDIPSTIKAEKEKGPTRLNNLLKRVHEKATEYLATVWKEYGDVSFTLQMDGTKIQCSISEENDFQFKDRSDGFKKFIAFLLSISSTSHTGKLQDALILIDEPEIGLHPSGARYFRDELLKVSTNNQVVYSTHSIFMIDRHDISRHYIVRKDREVTSLEEGNEGNIVDEEVIFNAINYSTFEHLKEVNLLFEGWRDKQLFKKYTTKNHKQFFSQLGIVHGSGAPSFRSLVPTLEAAERKGLIVSDNDTAAKDNQKNYNEWGHEIKWLTYKQISKNTNAITGEDFIKNELLSSSVSAVTKKLGNEFTVSASSLPAHNKLKYIKDQLISDGRNSDEIKTIFKELKTAVFDSFKYDDITSDYAKFVKDLKDYIEKNLV